MLCQICDSQTYIRTVHKLTVYAPSEILIVSTAASPKSKLFSIIEENLQAINSKLTLLDRRYWAEPAGYDYIQALAFAEDVESIKIAVSGNYYAVCSIAAVSVVVWFSILVTQNPPGHQIHRAWLGNDLPIALFEVQVRKIRRFNDD